MYKTLFSLPSSKTEETDSDVSIYTLTFKLIQQLWKEIFPESQRKQYKQYLIINVILIRK